MDLQEAKGQFEGTRTVVIGQPCAYSETHEAYVCICSGGPREEGQRIPALYSTPELAIAEWLRAVRNYAIGKSGTLYWREPPQLESTIKSDADASPEYDSKLEYWAVYSRLLISDKPVVEEAPA